jgi:O-antigen/teichoic acid export membrane protein
LKGEDNTYVYHSVFWSNLWLKQFIAIITVGVILLLALPFYNNFDKDFRENIWVLVILLISVFPELMATSVYQLMYSADRMWQSLFMIVVPRDLFYLCLAALLIPSFGGLSASIAYLAAHIVGLGATLITASLYAGKNVLPKIGSKELP